MLNAPKPTCAHNQTLSPGRSLSEHTNEQNIHEFHMLRSLENSLSASNTKICLIERDPIRVYARWQFENWRNGDFLAD